jgi:hypothetical protein
MFVADAPQSTAEAHACIESQKLASEVDWDCDVHVNFSHEHLGCALRVSTGLSWVFQQEETAIFLEDDCIPDASFFQFCEELLERYSGEEKVTMITGFNLLSEWNSRKYSYHFSQLGSSWGWATWRRSWKHFDLQMADWTSNRSSLMRLKDELRNETLVQSRAELFDKASRKLMDSWAVPWNFSMIMNGGLCAVPCVNLISNVGFGIDATHHKHMVDPNYGVPVRSMTFPLRHPATREPDRDFDSLWHKKACGDA